MMDALDIALILARCSGDPHALPRDPATGLYLADGTTPPTELRLPEYEAGIKSLDALRRAQQKAGTRS